MNNELINTLPCAFCNVALNKDYKKLVSQSIILVDKDDEGNFEFIAEYIKDKFIVFTVNVNRKEDDGECRVIYRIKDETSDNIDMDIYNTNKSNGSNYTILCDVKKVTEIENKSFYIRPKIDVWVNGITEITIDLYTK